MNGRIYDPRLGRFLQADPIVQAPKYSQSLNRYTYVFNNPLSYTDPSGYEGFLVASVISSFFAFIADRFNRPEDQAISTKPSEFLKQNSVPGALSNAFGDQTGRIDKEQFIQTDVSAATIGETNSDETGGKFANGGDTDTFWDVISSNSPKILRDALSETAVFIDEAFGVAIGQGVLDVSGAGPVVESVANTIDGDLKAAGTASIGLFIGKLKAAIKAGKWIYGKHKTPTKWANQMKKRGWTENQINEAIERGRKFPAENKVNSGHSATRFVHPKTGRSVVIDDVTKEVIHVGGDGFKY